MRSLLSKFISIYLFILGLILSTSLVMGETWRQIPSSNDVVRYEKGDSCGIIAITVKCDINKFELVPELKVIGDWIGPRIDIRETNGDFPSLIFYTTKRTFIISASENNTVFIGRVRGWSGFTYICEVSESFFLSDGPDEAEIAYITLIDSIPVFSSGNYSECKTQSSETNKHDKKR